MNKDFPVLIERRLLFTEDQDSAPRELAIQIGQPYWIQEDFEAACPVAIQGLLGRVEDIHGVDFFEALALSIEFVNITLAKMKEKRVFSWPSGEPYFDVDE